MSVHQGTRREKMELNLLFWVCTPKGTASSDSYPTTWFVSKKATFFVRALAPSSLGRCRDAGRQKICRGGYGVCWCDRESCLKADEIGSNGRRPSPVIALSSLCHGLQVFKAGSLTVTQPQFNKGRGERDLNQCQTSSRWWAYRRDRACTSWQVCEKKLPVTLHIQTLARIEMGQGMFIQSPNEGNLNTSSAFKPTISPQSHQTADVGRMFVQRRLRYFDLVQWNRPDGISHAWPSRWKKTSHKDKKTITTNLRNEALMHLTRLIWGDATTMQNLPVVDFVWNGLFLDVSRLRRRPALVSFVDKRDVAKIHIARLFKQVVGYAQSNWWA